MMDPKLNIRAFLWMEAVRKIRCLFQDWLIKVGAGSQKRKEGIVYGLVCLELSLRFLMRQCLVSFLQLMVVS